MEQDTEYMKLPLEERCAHKVLIAFKIFVIFFSYGQIVFLSVAIIAMNVSQIYENRD